MHFEGWDLHCKCVCVCVCIYIYIYIDVVDVYRLFHRFYTFDIQISSTMTTFIFFIYVQRLRIINLCSFIYGFNFDVKT